MLTYDLIGNSTATLTQSGRPVDAVIAPLAPCTAARPEMYNYYGKSPFGDSGLYFTSSNTNIYIVGYSTIVNFLDYATTVLPVTLADKTIDVVTPGYKSLNKLDEESYASCELSPA